MESPRLHRLALTLLLAAAAQFPALANDAAATEPGNGVRPADTAEPATPKERPRLRDNEVVSLRRRLEVHGGVSFTYGWGSGGNFREVGAWTSYFDPESGLGLAVGFSRLSGNVPYDYGYDPYSLDGYGRRGWGYGSPRSQYDVDLFLVRPNFGIELGFSQAEFTPRSRFDGSGSSLQLGPGRRF